MPKINVERNTFVRGLITESSPLTYPENASIAETNFVLNRDGSRQRRRGMDYENDYVILDTELNSTNYANTRVTGYRWENANNDPTITICVAQVGRKIWFFDGFADILSDNVLGSITLTSIQAQSLTQFTSINGNLICVNPAFSLPKLIRYDGTTFTETSIEIQVRDIWGVDDGFEVEYRVPIGDLTIEHEYNLFNQGWPSARDVKQYPHRLMASSNSDPQLRNYPSNADVWHIGKNSSDDFDYTLILKSDIGSREAAKGRFILDAFNRGQSRRNIIQEMLDRDYYIPLSIIGFKWLTAYVKNSELEDIPLDSERSYLATVTTYAGRVFYAGIDSVVEDGDANTPMYSATIFYSQVVSGDKDLGKCYSINDPTSEDFNISLATDGGTITIPEASRILKLINKDTSLVVIAENGVWEIAGPDGVFRADDFSIRQITNIGAVNAESVVNAEGNIYFWSKAGIYTLTPQTNTGRLTATNISETTIQTLYVNIESVARTNAIARYDSDARRISWLYNDSDVYTGVTFKNKYNKELILDVVLSAFYTSDIGEVATDSSYVAGYMPTGGFNVITEQQGVTVNGEQVVVNGENVVVSARVRSKGQSSTKYIAIKPNSTGNVEFTFSLYNNSNFKDWYSDDGIGVDAIASLTTGYELFADTARKKQISYLTTHFKLTEVEFELIGDDLEAVNPSSCLIQSQWDWSNNSASGKFGTQFQAYRLPRNYTPTSIGAYEYGNSVITTKNKIRGMGKAFSMKIDSEPNKDLHIYGWSMNVEGGADV